MCQSALLARLAPGLYDVKEYAKDPQRIEKARGMLLSERDVRRYCFAKQSGEELTSMFPLWDEEQEKRWAMWGKAKLNSDDWGSLMAVSSPEKWQAESDLERTKWLQWKRDGRWRYKVSWHDDLPSEVPNVRDVLLVAQCARSIGHMTWIRANYLLGASQINERTGLSTIVLGVILGLISPSGRTRWVAQGTSPDFDREWISYENLLISDPELSWRDPIFQSRFTSASLRAASGELGWIEANEISVLRSLSASGDSQSHSILSLHVEQESIEDGDIRI
jgi:hypothetical protein